MDYETIHNVKFTFTNDITKIDILPSILTKTEYVCLRILLYKKHPMTTRAIRKYINDNKAIELITKSTLWTTYSCTIEKTPSYEGIDSSLNSMMSLGLVSKRIDSNKNAKYLWVLNPLFLQKWNERVSQIKRKKSEGKKS